MNWFLGSGPSGLGYLRLCFKVKKRCLRSFEFSYTTGKDVLCGVVVSVMSRSASATSPFPVG